MAFTTWATAPKEVIISGTLCFIQTFKSASNLGLVGCTIRFTPKGAAFFPVSFSNFFSSVFISTSQSSKPSVLRWLRAGKVPTIPFLQHSMTNCGPDIRNMGAATTGSASSFMKAAFLLIWIVVLKNRIYLDNPKVRNYYN